MMVNLCPSSPKIPTNNTPQPANEPHQSQIRHTKTHTYNNQTRKEVEGGEEEKGRGEERHPEKRKGKKEREGRGKSESI